MKNKKRRAIRRFNRRMNLRKDNDPLLDKFYGERNYIVFKKEGVVELKNYEPFRMMKFVDEVYDWFNNHCRHIDDDDESLEVMLVTPDTLISLDYYMEEELDRLGYSSSKHLGGDDIGFRKGFRLHFWQGGYVSFAFIFDRDNSEVTYIMFKKKDIKKFHDYLFTHMVFKERNKLGMT